MNSIGRLVLQGVTTRLCMCVQRYGKMFASWRNMHLGVFSRLHPLYTIYFLIKLTLLALSFTFLCMLNKNQKD